jgi:hypothetical protein
MGIESLRMFFWESTSLGFVEYPRWLQNFYDFMPFYNGIRLIMFLLTIISFTWLLLKIVKRRRDVWDINSSDTQPVQIGFFMILIIVSYTGCFSFFSVVTRNSLTLIPLYLLTIAYFFDGGRRERR